MPPITFKASFRVSWVDTDAAQVMHFSNYFRFFERAEEEFYRHLGINLRDAAEAGFWLPSVEAFCQFKHPARLNDLLEVELTVDELREKSVKYRFKILNKETALLLASGHVVIVAADKRTGKATQIPLEIAEKIKPFCK